MKSSTYFNKRNEEVKMKYFNHLSLFKINLFSFHAINMMSMPIFSSSTIYVYSSRHGRHLLFHFFFHEELKDLLKKIYNKERRNARAINYILLI